MIIIYRIVRFSPKRWTFEGNYFAPNIQAGQFEAETFQREKENLKAYLESIVEDKQTYASLALQSVYFNQSEDQKIPSFGTVAALAEETAASLAAYYQKCWRKIKWIFCFR